MVLKARGGHGLTRGQSNVSCLSRAPALTCYRWNWSTLQVSSVTSSHGGCNEPQLRSYPFPKNTSLPCWSRLLRSNLATTGQASSATAPFQEAAGQIFKVLIFPFLLFCLRDCFYYISGTNKLCSLNDLVWDFAFLFYS